MAKGRLRVNEGERERLTLQLPKLMTAFLRKAARDSGGGVSGVVHDLVLDAMMRSFQDGKVVDSETRAPADVSGDRRDRVVLGSIGLKRMGAMGAVEVLAIRRRLGLSQKRLAEKLRVDVMTVSRWERGVVGVRPRHAFRLRMLAQKAKGTGQG